MALWSLPRFGRRGVLFLSAALVPLVLLCTATASSNIASALSHATSTSSSSSSSYPPTSASAVLDLSPFTASHLGLHNLTAMATQHAQDSASIHTFAASDVPTTAAGSPSSSPPLSSGSSFFSSLCLIFLAELGDRTFLSTLFLSSSLPTASSSPLSAESLTLLFGSNAAAATLAVLSALLSTVSASLFTAWGLALLRGVASAACVCFGVQMLYDTYTDSSSSAERPLITDGEAPGKALQSGPSRPSTGRSILSLFAHTYLMALATELGDHSQFSFLMLTSHPAASAVPIVLGGVLGHILCTLLAIVGGGWLGRLGCHERQVRWIGGGLFLGMALLQMVC